MEDCKCRCVAEMAPQCRAKGGIRRTCLCAGSDSRPWLHLVIHRPCIVLAVQWSELAHLCRRGAYPCTHLARNLPHARLSSALLGQQAHFSALRGLCDSGSRTWRAGEVAASVGGLSGASRRFTGSYEAGSFSGNAFPLTSWLNDNPKPINSEEWQLQIGGAVSSPIKLHYDELLADTELTATLDCTGGWHSTQVWRGVRLADLLAASQPAEDAASVTLRSATGYFRRFSLSEAGRYIVATHVGGETLSHGHGFPARLVAPDKRGFEWVKWITEIEVNRTGKWLQPPLPLQ